MMKLFISFFIFSSLAFSQNISITSISFSDNILNILYEGKNPKFQVSKDNNNRIIININNASLKNQKDYAVKSDIIRSITTEKKNLDLNVIVEPLFPVEYSVFEGENIISIRFMRTSTSKTEEVKIIAPKKTSSGRDFSKSGDISDILPKYRIDLDYSDANIRTVIVQMMQRAGINVIFDNDVAGTITVFLKNVPFDEAFKTVLGMKGLVAQQISENVIRISTPKKILEDQKSSVLQTRIFFLNYVKASDLKSQIESIAQAEGRTTAKCNVDETNNALIVTDTLYGLDMVEKLVKKLDRMPKQVLIEAKLVEVSLDSGLHTGVQWGVAYNAGTSKIGLGNVDNPVKDLAGNPLYALPFYGEGAGTGVSLPAEQIYGSFRFLKVTSKTVLDATLSAAAKQGKANILSNPKIATLNNKEASINITNQIPYVTTEITNTSGGSVASQKVTYITAGIVLNVLPTITSDGRIIMKITPKVSKPSQAAQFQPPSIDERTANTTVVVNDGETIVIGGLIHETEGEYLYKVPVLGDIPVLGYLFKKKSKEKNRMELLIFVTPKILE